MAKLSRQVASTSQSFNIFIQNSASTTGAGLTGLVFNSSGLIAYYVLPRAAAVSITLATQTVTGAFSSGGFVEISSTNCPGLYRVDLPDAALASGSFVTVYLQGVTNMAPCVLEIELTAWNNQDAVRGGLTALPNAAAEAAGGLYTRGTGAGQINQPANGNIDANVKTWLSGTIPAVNVTGIPLVDLKYTLGTISPAAAGSVRADAVTGTVGSVTGAVGSVTGAVGSVTAPISITAGQLFIKKNTQVTITFPMTDSTNHLPATGLTVTARRTIDGAAVGACANGVTELSLGLYSIVLTAADVNGTMITLAFSATAADTRWIGLVTQA